MSGSTPAPPSPPSARRGVAPFGEPLVDAATVAAYLAVDATTVYRLAKRSQLPSIEIAPRVLRFRPEDVRAFIEKRTRGAVSRRGRVGQLLGEKSP